MQKTITLGSGVVCTWIDIYNINLKAEEIEIACYVNEGSFNNSNWSVKNMTIKAEGVFTEEALSPENKTPKILAEEFLQTYEF